MSKEYTLTFRSMELDNIVGTYRVSNIEDIEHVRGFGKIFAGVASVDYDTPMYFASAVQILSQEEIASGKQADFSMEVTPAYYGYEQDGEFPKVTVHY